MDALQASNEAKDADIEKLQKKIDKITNDKETSESKLKSLMDEMKDKNAKLVSDLKDKEDKEETISDPKAVVKDLERVL